MKKLGLIMLVISLAVGFTFLGCDQTYTGSTKAAAITAALAGAQAKAEAIDAANTAPEGSQTVSLAGAIVLDNNYNEYGHGWWKKIELDLKSIPTAGSKVTVEFAYSASRAITDKVEFMLVDCSPAASYWRELGKANVATLAQNLSGTVEFELDKSATGKSGQPVTFIVNIAEDDEDDGNTDGPVTLTFSQLDVTIEF